eukprot:2856455-Prymnesium_polylepis.1
METAGRVRTRSRGMSPSAAMPCLPAPGEHLTHARPSTPLAGDRCSDELPHVRLERAIGVVDARQAPRLGVHPQTQPARHRGGVHLLEGGLGL